MAYNPSFKSPHLKIKRKQLQQLSDSAKRKSPFATLTEETAEDAEDEVTTLDDRAQTVTAGNSKFAQERLKLGEGHLSVETMETHALPAPQPAAADSLLPEGWSRHCTPEGNEYFYNTLTGTTTWSLPTAD